MDKAVYEKAADFLKIVRDILAGKKDPDLSALPEELAKLVSDELTK